MGFDYTAVPWPADAADPHPELRVELEGAGFRLLGGCALSEEGGRAVDKMSRSYGPTRGPEFARWAREPLQVFAAPDGSTFAMLGWLWECRYAVFTSVLPDGRVLDTMTAWGSDPVWPRALARSYSRTTDTHTEQLILATDLEAQVVPGTLDAAWQVHRERLTALEHVPDHVALSDFADVYTAESRARSRWVRRVQVVTGMIAFAAVVVPYVPASMAMAQQPWWMTIGLVVVALLVALAANQWLWFRVRRWRWLRPRFRAPVPGAGGLAGRSTS